MAGIEGKPKKKRRQQAAVLRAQGLTLAQIAARLGISRQAVQHLLRPRKVYAVHCARCDALIQSSGKRADTRGGLCLQCLGRTPGASFGQRLQAFRLAAGLSREALAERVGMTTGAIWKLEKGYASRPFRATLVKLVTALGSDLAEVPPLRTRIPGKRGRRPDLERRRQVAELRRQGLTLKEIGNRLGITRQAVHQLLDGRERS
jgi:transcriptional regulator with XRE-family HTH domain